VIGGTSGIGFATAAAALDAGATVTIAAPFRYFDKGNLAVVGKGFAVLESGKICVSGFAA
jgi:NAD(P)-dependent dehydrogenase (short-subunit alcohol dehydrogenase family)